MSKIEDVLAPGSIEMPDCQCGVEMRLSKSEVIEKSPDTEVRIYECPACRHEMRLMVWSEQTRT